MEDKEPLNDNERLGLPKDIDLLESALDILRKDPSDLKRVMHLSDVMDRVRPQVRDKERELVEVVKKQ
ncbi:hypothetical protein [Vibrio crassostreae]|uniref:hypothetical protein n=1 Tax=Vibrio crassostreae TaxID=246167 RepID=UPI001B316A61|nr:hypothetical protein [Vibrio crassostreae]